MHTSRSPLTIAVLQSAGEEADVDANLATLLGAAIEARDDGAALLVTPEMFVTGYNIGARLAAVVDDELEPRLQSLARDVGIGLVVGTGLPGDGGVANALLCIDEEGRVLARYDKTHLFGELDRKLFVEGRTLGPVIEYRGIRLGFLICYDVEFPENVRALALAGAELIIVPTAQMEPFAFIAEQLIAVRAWENQVAIAYANRVGAEGDLRYVGRSSIVAQDGGTLAAAGPDEAAILTATIDADAVLAARLANPYLSDRRPTLPIASPPVNGAPE